jgi:hypothetical protein
VFVSSAFPNLVVVDKANGRRADAINAGVNLARYPLLCIIDADSVLERDALLHVVRPFQRNASVAAATGMVRPANGLVVEEGEIVSAREPRGTLALMQAVEYLRSFQWARLGLSRLSSMLCISGAFMVVRKDVFIAMKGVDPTSITDDIEFTVRLHRHVYEQPAETRQRICYVPDAVCYTEVPETHRVYAAQRNRWQRGTLQALLRNWRMTFNPRYGLAGLFGMPFFLFFEAFAALVEGVSYALIPVAFVLGLATLSQLGAFLALAIVLGSLLSVAAILSAGDDAPARREHARPAAPDRRGVRREPALPPAALAVAHRRHVRLPRAAPHRSRTDGPLRVVPAMSRDDPGNDMLDTRTIAGGAPPAPRLAPSVADTVVAVVGLGYVGLPLAVGFGKRLRTIG